MATTFRFRALLVAGLLLAAAPAVLDHELSETWVCRRDGPRAGFCYGEPTLARRVLDPEWDDDYPRISTTPILPFADLSDARPAGDGGVYIKTSKDCWTRLRPGSSWCRSRAMGGGDWWFYLGDRRHVSTSDERVFADRFNAFLQKPDQTVFLHRLREPQPWLLFFYPAAALALGLAVHEGAQIRMRRRLAALAVEEPPSTLGSVYRD